MVVIARMVGIALPLSFTQGAVVKVSPVNKVIGLLKQLQTDTEAQGEKEAKAYDKYACFCKEQADEKIYQIEKSEKKMKKLNAQIDNLDTEIDELNEDISNLGKEIEDKATKIKDAADARATEHDAYKVEDADISGAINSMRGAIAALKDSKGAMEGNAKVDLAQIRGIAKQVLAVVSKTHRIAVEKAKLGKVVALAQQEPASYEYRSNDIITTLEDLLAIFIKNKKETDEEEFQARAAWEKKDGNMKNIKKFAEKEKAEKEAVSEEKSAERSAAKEDLDEETKDKESDSAFMAVLTDECEKKASLWDQRRSTRADEIKAMSGAMKALTEKVAPSWGANKKLAQIQAQAKPMSFLQVNKKAPVQTAQKIVSAAAKSIGSSALTMLAVKIQLGEDHFVKVRSLIKDLVSKLEEDAAAEADQKSFCDKAMSENINGRDEAKADIESHTAEQARDEAEKQELTIEVADLSKAIAGLNKALKEATDMRREERTENEETVDKAKEGKSGVELALNLLNEFYKAAGGEFVQYTPPNADRDGLTVADRAPEVFDSEYKGQQGGSKGIIGLLEVVLSDFERTISNTEEDEAAAQEEFEALEGDTEKDMESKQESKQTKEDRIIEVKDELTQTADSLKEQGDLLKNAEDTLAELKVQCVDGTETYAERVAKREKEIAALKEALTVLEEWQN